jgi:hypothetical protein
LEKEVRYVKQEIKQCEKENKFLDNYVSKISLMSKPKSLKTIYKRFYKLYNAIKELLEEITDFITRLNKKLDIVTNYLRCENLPSINNNLKGYFGIILTRYLKKRYRTEKKLEIRL